MFKLYIFIEYIYENSIFIYYTFGTRLIGLGMYFTQSAKCYFTYKIKFLKNNKINKNQFSNNICYNLY